MLRKPSGDPRGTVSLSEGEVMNGDCAVQRHSIKRVIKRANVERGNVGSKQRSDEQRSLKRLRTRNFIKRVTLSDSCE